MMKLNRITQGLLALGLACATTAALASTPFSTAVTPGYPENSVEFKLGFLNENSAKVGRYKGQVEKGFEPSLNLNYLFKDVEKGQFSHTKIEGAGTETLRLRNRTGIQGDFAVGIDYRQRALFQYQGVKLPYLDRDGALVSAKDADRSWNIDHKRESVRIDGQKVVGENWKINFMLNQEDKIGNRLQGFGTWQGNDNGFLFAAPTMQRTSQFEVGAEYREAKWQGRITYHLSKFEQLGDNFFHPTNVQNGGTETLSLAPENSFHRLSLQGAYALSNATRFSGEIDYGLALQDDAFVQYGLDTVSLSNLNAIDQDSLDGKYETIRVGLRASHRLNPGIMLRASYRLDERDNSTSKHTDLKREFSSRLRDTRTHSWTRHTVDADANIRLPLRSNLLIGTKFEDTDRKQGARGETQEGTVHARIRSQVASSLTAGLKGSYSQLTGSEYNENYLDNGDGVRAFHLASVDKTLVTANTSWNGLEQLALGLEVTYKDFDYKESNRGLKSDKRLATTLTADYFPSAAFSGYAFVTYEDGERVRNDKNNILTSELTTLSVGAGGKYQLTADGRYNLGLDFLMVNSKEPIKARVGESYTDLKSELSELRLYGDYKYSEALSFNLSYLTQKYKEVDWGLTENNLGGYESYLISPYDETVHLVVGSATYRF